MVTSMDFSDQMTLFTIFSWTATVLVILVGLIIAYWVIRLAVTHGLRSHHRWLQDNR